MASLPSVAFASSLADAASEQQLDISEWYSAYQSCQFFFLDQAQHEAGVEAVCALMNICLPSQWADSPLFNVSSLQTHASGPGAQGISSRRPGPVSDTRTQPAAARVSLIPFIRRLVVTGMDTTSIMHGFFGDDWRQGVGPMHECERKNYLFAAKSVGWADVKCLYDMSPHETVPFMKPLQQVQLVEIERAESAWSRWLAMEDWMVGPRAPDAGCHEQ
ncbi:hypothetical protein T440DRAFT_79176 [Plenodomus tracheiphilus IPT5]|uniref:Uncharacterized protein n=1 Tax=Plenodomus tracheiphilus IPT5 TaxID=1408161 RepID=A0A6A7B6A0_9PLEO|nr:hypothetical protein T440DRAFT_79176 [Plenodomus tracheiphilus IPT5]